MPPGAPIPCSAGLSRVSKGSTEAISLVDVRKRFGDVGDELRGTREIVVGEEGIEDRLDHGFAELGLHRVHAHCVAENVASARVLERPAMVDGAGPHK